MAEDLTRRTAGSGPFPAVAGGGTDGCVPAAKRAVMPNYTTFFVSNMRLKLPLRQHYAYSDRAVPARFTNGSVSVSVKAAGPSSTAFESASASKAYRMLHFPFGGTAYPRDAHRH
ncbi:hypothetical protein PPGU19_025410 [Paraburkholderia sp. PGU19]|nr:hypothetical protein PPGU19_025410 [Paraburkholderia sp. PGU19]